MNTDSLNKNKNEVCVRYLDAYPDLLPLHKNNRSRYPFLLESVARGTPQARYDILFAFPGETLVQYQSGTEPDENILSKFDALWKKSEQSSHCYVDVPFTGGWFTFLSYELAAIIEPGLKIPYSNTGNSKGTPLACFTRVPAAIIRDHQLKRIVLVAEHGNKGMLDKMQFDVFSGLQSVTDQHTDKPMDNVSLDIVEEDNKNYLASVEKIKRYIVDGDVFQVNLSRLWHTTLPENKNAADLYSSLRTSNPAPFAGLASYENFSIISSSPERLVMVRNNQVETRPIAGTRPRSQDPAQDESRTQELISDPKERAEHIMLIDLERNDLGRVCETGSVRLDELMVIETYSHVHHIVSNVCGKLKQGATPADVIRAVFPGGTITGCPKIRCMQILAELEKAPRGAYTGSMGYINLDGSMDLNILIRTMVLDGDKLELRAGGGIVMDSEPAKELLETRAKAQGMLAALGGEQYEL